jgi:flagellar biosynthesis protein FliQ
MSPDQVVEVGGLLLITAAKIALPFLISILTVGFLVGLLQSVTQLQEQTLSFVPKLIVTALVLLLAGNWMLGELLGFADAMVERIPSLLKGS